mgnify:CR=1 FL=1
MAEQQAQQSSARLIETDAVKHVEETKYKLEDIEKQLDSQSYLNAQIERQAKE